ncbi:putative secreted protein [Wickerhamomyces ciferrii]|uniref:Secreted protein n=1 Tax=Wickerhamomyces ciferrii (strain ATCC 14091 / BCRC 22168 / CBS 111 / JCM 3599 / NBRC 0793 / NRRL Y-1031 F-60-10) TaxID=1206466 RepID=K0KJ08_WICCF|nr:uncharacterized protein BN7_4791 [Wickerhamomyces ciferrii]CCH45210.1 putative secreted protein [Wickerhamomyces ciferrii]
MILLGTLLVLFGVFSLSWRLNEFSDSKDNIYNSLKRNSINSNTERSLLLSPGTNMIQTQSNQFNTSFGSNLDENFGDNTEYISFGSPKGESPIVINDEPGYTSDELDHVSKSPILSPFKYGSIIDNNPSGIIGSKNQKRRSKRVLSYEQNELLNQLKKMPDV